MPPSLWRSTSPMESSASRFSTGSSPGRKLHWSRYAVSPRRRSRLAGWSPASSNAAVETMSFSSIARRSHCAGKTPFPSNPLAIQRTIAELSPSGIPGADRLTVEWKVGFDVDADAYDQSGEGIVGACGHAGHDEARYPLMALASANGYTHELPASRSSLPMTVTVHRESEMSSTRSAGP